MSVIIVSVAFFPDFGGAALLPALMAILPLRASTGLGAAGVFVAALLGREVGAGFAFTAGRGAAAGLCAAAWGAALVAALVGRDAGAGGFAFPVERGATADFCAAEALFVALVGRDAGASFLLTSYSPRIGGYTCSVGRLRHSLPLRKPRIVATLRECRFQAKNQTRQPSNPCNKMSFGRSMPIKTILLVLVSPGTHFGPRSLPIN